ncbi:MAG: tetratricopeptide repeat protein [Elusimicrobiota bacterium]|nr:tetratricopeptide repeat protein [Elusimicrobiota bacterium]
MPEEKNLSWKLPAFIALAGCLLYAASLRFGFTYLDDDILILDHMNFLRNAGNILSAFRHDVFFQPHAAFVFYRPLLTLSFMLDAQLGGAAPFVYHLTNLLLHLLSSILLFRLLIKMKYNSAPAFYLSLFFTLHPAISQAVYWIPGRNDSLLAVFSISAFLAALNFWKTGRRRYAAWHILFFALALFTKETAVALVPVCLLYRLLIDKKPLASTGLFLAPGWAAAMSLYFLLRHFVMANPTDIFSLGLGAAANILIVLPYLGNILFPFHLPVVAVQRDLPVIYGLIMLALTACALAVSKAKRWDRIAFGSAWFLLFLIPSNSISSSYFMAHRMYLPFIGVILVLLEIDRVKDFKGKGAAVLGAAALAVFPSVTFLHGRNFKDRMSYWQNAAANSPNSERAKHGLGSALAAAGRLDEAGSYFEEALWIDPGYYHAHYSWACFLAGQGRDEEADGHFRAALAIAPKDAEIYNRWGMLAAGQGRPAEAIARYGYALRLRPDLAEAHYNWGRALAAANEPEEAAAHFREALRIDPDLRGVRYGLGMVLAGQGRDEEAAALFREAAARINPGDDEDYNNWGVVLAMQGRKEEAEARYREALRINPENAEAHQNLGLDLVEQGRLEEAAAQYSAALRLNPGYPEAHNSLGILLVKEGRLDEALKHFRAALKAAPGDPKAQANLRITLRNMEIWDRHEWR